MKSAAGVKEEGVTSPMEKSGETQQSLKKGPWTATEDSILADYVRKHGEGNWNAVQKNSGLQRCGKSCRLRWANHLRPNLKKGSFSPEEEALILQLHAQLGNKWARMAAQLPGRTDNEIKNYWNTRIKRRQRAGLPLYPPEIQRQVAYLNQRQGTVMILPNSIQHNNLMPTVSSAGAALFRNAAAVSGRGGGANYILANFDICLPSQQIPSSALYLGCEEGKAQQQLAAAPVAAMIGQGNSALMNALFKESQGSGEFFNEGLFFEPLPTACAPLSELPLQSPPLSSKCSGIDSLGKMEDSDISIETQVNMQSGDMIATHDTSNLLDMVPIYMPTGPTTMVLSDWCCSGPSSVVTENVANTDMHHLSSSLSVAHDWSFTSGTWEAMTGIR